MLVGALGRRKVVGDLDARPFFVGVRGGDGRLSVLLVGELVHGGEDGVGAVGVAMRSTKGWTSRPAGSWAARANGVTLTRKVE